MSGLFALNSLGAALLLLQGGFGFVVSAAQVASFAGFWSSQVISIVKPIVKGKLEQWITDQDHQKLMVGPAIRLMSGVIATGVAALFGWGAQFVGLLEPGASLITVIAISWPVAWTTFQVETLTDRKKK